MSRDDELLPEAVRRALMQKGPRLFRNETVEHWAGRIIDHARFIQIEMRDAAECEKRSHPIIHGKTCKKVPHTGAGYLHGSEDDRPYDVDGLTYCGRCHWYIDDRGR